MYNLKVEAERLMNILCSKGYDCKFIGPYPYMKYYNSLHDEKLRTKDIQFVTSATLDQLKEVLKVVEVGTDYNNYAIIETELKQNLTYFKVYYMDKCISKVDGSVIEPKNINEILLSMDFLINTITIDLNGKMHCINNKDGINGYDAIKSGKLISNGDFEELIKRNPMAMLEACVYVSNLPYELPDEYKEIMKKNYNYLQYESLKDIRNYIYKIIKANKPLIGLNIIKETLINFEVNGVKIFDFVNYLENKEDIIKLKNEDFISRWSYILNGIPMDIVEKTIDSFNLEKKKLLWLIEYFDLPKSNNIKESIYEASKSISSINSNKRMHNVFTLYHMINTLSKIYKILDPDNSNKYNKMVNLICARPFFNDQVLYEDEDIPKIINKDISDLERYKTKLVKTILMMDEHPDDEQYLEVMREVAKDF